MSVTSRQLNTRERLFSLDNYQLSDFGSRIKCFYEILTLPPVGLRQVLDRFLAAGCQMFAVECGFIGQKIGTVVRVVSSRSQDQMLYDGQLIQVSDSLIQQVLGQDGNFSADNVIDSSHQLLSLSYNGRHVQNVLAVPLVVQNEVFGSLCFFSRHPHDRPYSAEDRETILLAAKGVAKMIELHASFKEPKKSDSTDSAASGVKPFDDYLLQARLPEVYGVAGKVVDVLKNRVGHASLSIGDIALELSMSKRTLQRRLQQQDVNFADLRDQVRFHFSVDYLVEQNTSIDSISGALDFSDRTSFTNAFKRWTGLSPSAFRKFFRDYV